MQFIAAYICEMRKLNTHTERKSKWEEFIFYSIQLVDEMLAENRQKVKSKPANKMFWNAFDKIRGQKIKLNK